MLAVVKTGPEPGFALCDRPVPELRPGTVLVRVRAVGICGSDLPIFSGRRPVPYPLVPGHEFSGEIVAVAPDVTGWQPGDRAAVGLVVGCGQCAACRGGEENLCPDLVEIGIHVDGAYAEYVRVPARTLHRLPEALSFVEGATADPLASSYHGLRRVRPQPEDRVVIFGPGPIGLYALQSVRAHGVAKVIVVAREAGRRSQAAADLGADRVIETEKEGLSPAVSQATGGRMASLVIEATGDPAVFASLPAVAAPRARILLLGIFHDDARLQPSFLVRRELRYEGSFCYNWGDFEASLDLLQRGQVTSRGVVSHILPLAEIGRALELIHQRQAIKVILEP